MIHKTGIFTGHGGMQLFHQSWIPEKGMKALAVIVHGGGDHSGRFGNVVEAFLPAGIGIAMPDLRGHGKSPGKRGHINAWDEYRQDLEHFLEVVRPGYAGVPQFLFGHSMGAVIVLDFCIRRQPAFDGIVCTSPAIGKLGIPPVMFRLARLLDRVWPSLVLPNGLVVPDLSRDEAFIAKTKSDPLYHTRSTPRFGMEMLRTVEFIHEKAHTIGLPLYLIHGRDDRIAAIEGSQKLADSLSKGRITYREYEGGYHELFNDLDKEIVLQDMVNWMVQLSGTR